MILWLSLSVKICWETSFLCYDAADEIATSVYNLESSLQNGPFLIHNSEGKMSLETSL